MPIDPEKLLQLARERHRDGGVTLSWPTVLNIIEELRWLQREVGYLQELQRAIPACRSHGHAHGECVAYSGRAPCETVPAGEEIDNAGH